MAALEKERENSDSYNSSLNAVGPFYRKVMIQNQLQTEYARLTDLYQLTWTS